jgi:hypothetical protein
VSGVVKTNLRSKGTDRPEFWAVTGVFAYQPTTVFPLFGVGPVIEVARFDDGDSDSETPLSGSTRENPVTGTPEAHSVVFLEAIRDYEFGRRKGAGEPDTARERFNDPFWGPQLAQQYRERILATIAHEVGHAPGRQSGESDHTEDGIMIRGAPQSLTGDNLRPSTIARFRNAQSWTQE